jgi:hypothetical protein
MPGGASRDAIIALDDQMLHLEPSHIELIDIEVTELAALDHQATDAKPADRQKSNGEGTNRGSANRSRSDRYGFPSRGWQCLSIFCSLHPCSPWCFGQYHF